ncbi:MAG TPA: biotin--[acetyl-CoA-carboxylase] ligase [Gemmatimonadales bacterium]|nr:biotin--[acetyl-CoA-carboxylase] ligase [Gemmatimonadales bacterium]
MAAPVFHYQRVGSTMDVIHALAERGAEAGTVVVAGEQLEGRGSRNRAWHSPPGGLWLSALFRPRSAGAVDVMSLRVGLALATALDQFAVSPVRLKWPNDLMLEDRKLGGILCEARWQGGSLSWVAVGVGLNVRNRIPAELRRFAASLAEDSPAIQEGPLLDSVIAAVRALDLCAERLSPEELEQFSGRHWLHGREIRGPVAGMVADVDSDGTLQVRTAEGSCVALRNASIELATATPIS